ncbi:MAG: ATP-binding protein [Pseudonocardiales bacterium]
MKRGALLVRHEAASAAIVRRQLARDLATYDLPSDAIDDAVLVASELVGNAVRHTAASATGTLDVSWHVDASGVRLSVGDPSGERPQARTAGDDEPSGRGLKIVAAMADEWGVDHDADGKRVWAHVPTRRDTTQSLS